MRKNIVSIIIGFYLVFLYTNCSNKDAEAEYQKVLIDFGRKLSLDTIRGEFVVKNIGDKSLLIEGVEATCGCTVPSYSRELILKNEIGKINFIYIPKRTDSGTIIQKLVVKTNGIKRLQVLTLTGIIKKI